MRSAKSVFISAFSIAAQNFRKWSTDYRIWVIAVLLAVMTFLFANDVRKNAEVLSSGVSIWIFPLLYVSRYMKLVFTLPVVLLFCNAPFVDKNQTFVMMRTSRPKWLCGQILYIIIAAAVYYLFVFLISIFSAIISTIFIADFTLDLNEWGGTFYSLAYGGVRMPDNVMKVEVPKIIIEYFTPIQACFFTFLLSWLGAVFLGMIIFFLNLVTQNRAAGTVAAFAFVIWAFMVKDTFGLGRYRKLSPLSWSTPDNIDVGGLTRYPTFGYCVTVLSVSILLLIAGSIIFGRKKSLDFKE